MGFWTTVKCTYKRPIHYTSSLFQKWMFTYYNIMYFITFLTKNAQLTSLTTKDHASNARHSCRGCLEREERLFIMGVKNKGAACPACFFAAGATGSLHQRVVHHSTTACSHTTQHNPALLCGKGDHYRNKT